MFSTDLAYIIGHVGADLVFVSYGRIISHFLRNISFALDFIGSN